MKRVWRYFILLAVLSALLCMSAFAAELPEFKAETGVTGVTTTMQADKFTLTYTGVTEGQCLILMVSQPEAAVASEEEPAYQISETTIQYVDQKAAGTSGVEFTIYPKEMTDAVILLASKDGIQELGTVSVPEEPTPTGVTVSGTAASWNSTDDAVYLLYAGTVDDATIKAEWKAGTYNAAYTGTKGTIAAATVDSKNMQSQSFSFEGVVDGTYKLAIFKPGKYVPKIVTVTVSGSDVELGTQKLWLYGDVDYNGEVDAIDVLQIDRNIASLGSIMGVGDAQTQKDRLDAANITATSLNDVALDAIDVLQINRYIASLGSMFDLVK